MVEPMVKNPGVEVEITELANRLPIHAHSASEEVC